jgi:hypothetical protein
LTRQDVFELNSHINAFPQPGLDQTPSLSVDTLPMKTTLLVVLVSAVLCGCSRSPKPYEEMSGGEQLNYLRAQADKAMLTEATNRVPGIRSVVEVNADTFSDSVEKWRGWVRLDYSSGSGGIEHTNIPMVFIVTFDGRLFGCMTSQLDAPVMGSSGDLPRM